MKDTERIFIERKNEMRERIIEVIKRVNEEILKYDGDNIIGEGIVDSFEIISLITEFEEEFNIEIDAEYVVAERLNNAEGIIKTIEMIMGA